MGIRLPESAADPVRTDKGKDDYIINPYVGKKMLSKKEAVDLINHLSGVLLIDECHKGQTEHKEYLRPKR
jgi:hypothetical protein